MKILRTPDERFADVADFPYTPRYVEVTDEQSNQTLRIHYVDEGPADAPVVLLMHGNPTWAYLYRKFIPTLVAAGHRVVAVDLVGCGRSDKLEDRQEYTQARYYEWMSKWLLELDLNDITLFCQDWGGTIGLYLVSQYPERFARVCAGNTGMPIGQGESEAMKGWVSMMAQVSEFPFDQVLAFGVVSRELTDAEKAAYRAPYPDGSYMSAIIHFPALIAAHPDNPGVPQNREAWERLKAYDKPFLTIWGDKDPITAGANEILKSSIVGAKGQDHVVLENAGHFLQEDAPEEITQRLLAFIAKG